MYAASGPHLLHLHVLLGTCSAMLDIMVQEQYVDKHLYMCPMAHMGTHVVKKRTCAVSFVLCRRKPLLLPPKLTRRFGKRHGVTHREKEREQERLM